MYSYPNFCIQEFVSQGVYSMLGDQSRRLIDPRILHTVQTLRTYIGSPIKINNWHIGGQFQHRGFRSKMCTVGAIHSMHRTGMAVDFTVDGYESETVRGIIIKNQTRLFPHVTRMESGVSWVHIDLKPTGKSEIYLFNP